jgi:hypothetical protein
MRVFSVFLRSWVLGVGRWALGVSALPLVLALAAIHPPSAILIFFLGVILTPFSYITLAVNPALVANYNDGNVVFACQDLTIPTAAAQGSPQVFSTEGFSLQFDSNWTVQKNSAARPSKQFGIPEIPILDLELQFISSSTAPPYPLGAEFNATTEWGVTYKFVTAKRTTGSKNDGSASKITIGARYVFNN